jgi:hypothetical protein
MNKVEEIFKSWGIAINPSDAQYNLAMKRMEICEGCIFKSNLPVKHCTVCGCSLKGKIYSPVEGACPKGFWDEVDTTHFLK